MLSHPGAGDSINSYALVSYVPGPLGLYLDRIRRELVTSCSAQSHVTILPPRPLPAGKEEVRPLLSAELCGWEPFTLELTGVEVFESTSVIYLAIGKGRKEVEDLHARLNRDVLAYQETHLCHPHVTLAQDFPPQELPDMVELARERWAEFTSDRSFRIERLTFVQNTTTNRWLDLVDIPLGKDESVYSNIFN